MSRELDRRGIDEILVDTGQHYDGLLSDTTIREVGLRPPDIDLQIGSGTHAEQTGRMMVALERTLLERRPDVVIVYGDTNTTLSGTIAAAKLDIPVAHVEAGARSGRRAMPEEINRVVADHLSDLLLAPTEAAMGNLRREGVAKRARLTGDVMADVLQAVLVDLPMPPAWAASRESFLVATLHRPENTDEPARLGEILGRLAALDDPVHLLAHPRLIARANESGNGPLLQAGSLVTRPPLGYATMIATLRQARGLITDSGGLQKEAFLLGVPCTTVRTETEWPETLEGGWNALAGDRLDLLGDIVGRPAPVPVERHAFGSGGAAGRVVDALIEFGRS